MLAEPTTPFLISMPLESNWRENKKDFESNKNTILKQCVLALVSVGQLAGASSPTLNGLSLIPSQSANPGCGFDPRLFGACTGGDQSMFLSHINVTHSLSPSSLLFF